MPKLLDFKHTPQEEFVYLKNLIDSLPDGVSYTLNNIELPKECTPCITNLSMFHIGDEYYSSIDPEVAYSGDNRALSGFFLTGRVRYSSWGVFMEFCSMIPEDTTFPMASLDLANVTDWEQVNIQASENETIVDYEDIKNELSKIVIGQDEAIEAISYQTALFLKKKKPKKPLSFLAYGPPGTGKSETAKSLADTLTKLSGKEYSTVWTDLNTFTEAFSVYRLTGAPPGYIGYDDVPIFEAVANNPYTIFIFDELDKAHAEVLKTFMAILDEGRLASRKELSDHTREFNFKRCIFFFTSNYDLSNPGGAKRPIGFTIPDIEMDERNEVRANYAASSVKDTSGNLPQRMYRETEKARKSFVEVGVLKEIASRFQCFVGYKKLDDDAKCRILAKQIIETGFEYGIKLTYIAPSIMQSIIDISSSEDSLTVRSHKAVIEGYLSDIFSKYGDSDSLKSFRLEGSLDSPKLKNSEENT